MAEKTDMESLNEFLIKLANARIGIRRKILILREYVNLPWDSRFEIQKIKDFLNDKKNL